MKQRGFLWRFVGLAIALAGCAPLFPSPTPTATATCTPSPSPWPTSTPTTTQTPTSTPTATPTATPEWANADLFDRTTWSERALAVWNNPEAVPLEEHQWFHQYLMGVTRNCLREVGEQNPFGLRSAVQRLIDPPNKARPIITSVTPEEFRRMSQLEVGQLVAGLDRRQQLWLLFELNTTLPEAERRVIPISSVDKAAILTDPLNFFVYYPQTV